MKQIDDLSVRGLLSCEGNRIVELGYSSVREKVSKVALNTISCAGDKQKSCYENFLLKSAVTAQPNRSLQMNTVKDRQATKSSR